MGNGVSTDDVLIGLERLYTDAINSSSNTTHSPRDHAVRKNANVQTNGSFVQKPWPRTAWNNLEAAINPKKCLRVWSYEEGMKESTPVSAKDLTPENVSKNKSYVLFSIGELHADRADAEEEMVCNKWNCFLRESMSPRGISVPVRCQSGGSNIARQAEEDGDKMLSWSVWVFNGLDCPPMVQAQALMGSYHLDTFIKGHKPQQYEILKKMLDRCQGGMNTLEGIPIPAEDFPIQADNPQSTRSTFRRLRACHPDRFDSISKFVVTLPGPPKSTPKAPPIPPPAEPNSAISNKVNSIRGAAAPVPKFKLNLKSMPSANANKPSLNLNLFDQNTPRGIKRDKEDAGTEKPRVKRSSIVKGTLGLNLGGMNNVPHRINTEDLSEKAQRQRELDENRHVCSEVLRGQLYISGYAVASDRRILQEHKITHIVNAAGDICTDMFPSDCKYLTYYLNDHRDEDISSVFYRTIDFIDAGLENGRVLIHCKEGVSRSSTLTIAYLMIKFEMRFKQAFEVVKKARPIANPNVGFVSQLWNFEKVVIRSQRRHEEETMDGIVDADKLRENSAPQSYHVTRHNSRVGFMVLHEFCLNRAVKVVPYDPRFAFVLRKENLFIGWIGEQCPRVEEAKKTIEEYVQWVKRHERVLECDLKVCHQNLEPQEFWEWNQVAVGYSDDGFIRIRAEFDKNYTLDCAGFQTAPLVNLRNGTGNNGHSDTNSFSSCTPRTPPSKSPRQSPRTPLSSPKSVTTPMTPISDLASRFAGTAEAELFENEDINIKDSYPQDSYECVSRFESEELYPENTYLLVPR